MTKDGGVMTVGAIGSGALAQLFGESAKQLQTDLVSGDTNLSELAQSRGISQSDLVNAIKSSETSRGWGQTEANGGPELSDAQMTDLANRIANRVHNGGNSKVAQLFGESTQQLKTDLQSGHTSLTALAAARGISQSDLLTAITSGWQHAAANIADPLTATQLANLASTIADRVHGVGPNAAASVDAQRAVFQLQTAS
jgi:lambda repressor-like predicted transcriptional regulator